MGGLSTQKLPNTHYIDQSRSANDEIVLELLATMKPV